MRRYVLLLFSALILLGCLDRKEHEDNLKFHIPVEMNIVSELNLEEIAKFHSIIPLQTTSESLIGKIEKIFIADSSIVIWDSQTKKILVFDKNGHYRHNISSRGNTNQEYLNIFDIFIQTDTIVVLDAKRVITFDLNGNFIGSRQLNYYLNSFLPFPEGYWGVSYYQNKERYNLVFLDKEKQDILYGNFKSKNNLPMLPCNNFVFNEPENEFYFYYPYNDTIYKIEDNRVIPTIFIDFGKNKYPFSNIDSKDFMEKRNSVNFLGRLHNVYMNDDKLFFSFFRHYGGENNLDLYHCFYSLSKLHFVVYNNNVKHSSEVPLPPLPNIIGISQNKLIFQIVPGILPENIFKKLENTKYNNIIEAESNPVLVLYELID